MSQSMRKWRLAAPGVEHLVLDTAARPLPGPGEIVVRVGAVSLNYRDLIIVRGDDADNPPQLPLTPASDMAGTVAALGAGVTRFREGDDVISTFWAGWIDGRWHEGARQLGSALPGMLAEYVVLHEDWAVRAPRTLNAAQASTLPCAGLTAWFALVETGAIHAGQTVLVQGTGGVALFGAQLARAHGADVIVISGSEDKLRRVRELGATHGIGRTANGDWAGAARELTGGRGVDHIFELAGGDNLHASVRALAQGGRISLIGVLDGFCMSLPSVPSFLGRPTIQGIGVGHRRALEDLVRAVDKLKLEPVIDTTYAFDAVPDAIAHLARGAFGKIVVDVGERAMTA
ncbi:zinc-dependent alcohol dehydrogenase family protein [Paraburkholderia phosphatilytica]|uniref:zinc-dependent alcohol dehydrogenase family protein n=1 Tax=Paraburkholderia phosphatilytica TaxID=2282883 RepID=UPI000E549333|nr:NAD(P)-dependent alcohol dehydrogenase [Paraburkholderia phosphatilytica]